MSVDDEQDYFDYEGVIWKLKKGLTGSYWKEHWARLASDDQGNLGFLQWPGKVCPKDTEPPKYIFQLKDCHIEESSLRKYCFQLSIPNEKEKIVFALNDFDTFEAWHEILSEFMMENHNAGLNQNSSHATSIMLNNELPIVPEQKTDNKTPSVVSNVDEGAKSSVSSQHRFNNALKANKLSISEKIYITNSSNNNHSSKMKIKTDLYTKDEKSNMNDNDAFFNYLKPLKEDLIADFFYENDVTKNPLNPSIKENDLRKLFRRIDSSLNSTFTCAYIKREIFNETAGSLVQYKSFKQWWEKHKEIINSYNKSKLFNINSIFSSSNLSNINNSETCHNQILSENSLLFCGIIDNQNINQSNLFSFLLRARVPHAKESYKSKIDRLRQIVTTPDNNFDWNEVYQEALEKTFSTQNCRINQLNDTSYNNNGGDDQSIDFKSVISNNHKQNQIKTNEFPTSESYRQAFTEEDIFKSSIEFVEVKSAFNEIATKGAKIIIDEYTLPNTLKTIPEIFITNNVNINTSSNTAFPQKTSHVFKYCGLLFTICESQPTRDDLNPSESHKKQLFMIDMMKHKELGNELKGLISIQNSIELLYTSFQINEKWQYEKSHSKYYDKSHNYHHNEDNNNKNQFFKPCTLLSTLIDYCGFRINVIAPIRIEEKNTLLHGYSKQYEGLFVDIYPEINNIITKISSDLNLKMNQIIVSLSNKIISENEEKNILNEQSVTILSSDLQVHEAIDDARIFLLNFKQLFPSLLSKQSNEMVFNNNNNNNLLSKMNLMRPEFIKQYSESLISSSILTNNLHFTDNNNNNNTDNNNNNNYINNNIQNMKSHLKACSYLYTTLLPQISIKLDEFNNNCMSFDSFSITEYLHNNGINIHLMGILFTLSKSPYSKHLLLCEMIGRACKVLLRYSLRTLIRKGKVESILAEIRNKSRKHDFIEQQELNLLQRKELILDFYNTIFGKNVKNDYFWEVTLNDILFDKFGIKLCKADRSVLIYMPQLLHSIQYHTNTFLHDISYSLLQNQSFSTTINYNNKNNNNYNNNITNPFTFDHFINVLNPNNKMKLSSLFKTGEMLTIISLGDHYLSQSFLKEAILLYNQQLSLLSLFLNDNFQNNQLIFATKYEPTQETLDNNNNNNCSLINHHYLNQILLIQYKLILTLYLNNEYTIAKEMIININKKHAQMRCNMTFIRILMILMCIEFKEYHNNINSNNNNKNNNHDNNNNNNNNNNNQREDKSRIYFDCCYEMICLLVTNIHPFISLLMTLYSDLYSSILTIQPDQTSIPALHNVTVSPGGDIIMNKSYASHAKTMMLLSRSTLIKSVSMS
eukprot:gene6061-8345_t